MANVERELERIENAIYGEEVRSSIHDAIAAMNEESEEAHSTAIDSQQSALNSKIAAETAQAAAEIAQTRAETAQTACESAQSAAETSKAAAEDAQNGAEIAQAAAETAQNGAEVAQAAAETAQSISEASQTAAQSSEENAFRYYTDTYNIYSSTGSGFILKGPGTIDTLPLNPEPGWRYVLTVSGMTDSRFAEGAGIVVPAGWSVYYTVDGLWSILKGEQSSSSDMWVITTLLASNWFNSTYSFENDYPSTSYDILNILPLSDATNDQRLAWINADCGGYYSTNVITAHGVTPEIDIPIALNIRNK